MLIVVSSWSGRRGSNSRPLAWKANALSTELLPQADSHCNAALTVVLHLGWGPLLLTTENHKRTIRLCANWTFEEVGEDGFEPPKALPTDLQSAPFGHSGTLPRYVLNFVCPFGLLWADGGIRTPDQLITNHLLWPTELHLQSLTLLWGCKYMRNFLFRKTSRQKI